jgi:beta-glucanase (GH16 family)
MISSGLAAGITATAGPPAHNRGRAGRYRMWWAGGGVVLLVVATVVGYVLWPRGWKLVWHDEFGGSSVQVGDWNVRNNTYLPYEHSILTSAPDNVRVGGGVLTIEAQQQRRTVGRTTREYTSGYLDTIGKNSWTYGRFEMRARLPTTAGMWPAFWLRADHGLGEIDIMEAIGGLPRMAQQAVLQSTQGDREKEVNRHDITTGTVADWHVYAATGTPASITFTIDGTQVFQVRADDVPWLRSTFDEPMNIRLNLQVGGTLPDYYQHPLDASTRLPAAYRIDWVRVYQRQ